MDNIKESSEVAELDRMTAMASLSPEEILDRLWELAVIFAMGTLRANTELKGLSNPDARILFEDAMKSEVIEPAWAMAVQTQLAMMGKRLN